MYENNSATPRAEPLPPGEIIVAVESYDGRPRAYTASGRVYQLRYVPDPDQAANAYRWAALPMLPWED